MTEREPQPIPPTEPPGGETGLPGASGHQDGLSQKVRTFLEDNAELFETVETFWGDVTDAKQAFQQACAVTRRVVGNEIVDGTHALTLQTPKSTNPRDWPAGTKSMEAFPVIEAYADRAKRRVKVLESWLLPFARDFTLRRVEIDTLLDTVFEKDPPEASPDVSLHGGGTQEYQEAHSALGITFDSAAVTQQLGIQKVELFLEDSGVVVPFLGKLGTIALARQEGNAQYPGLLETIAAEAGRARIEHRKTMLQAALQRVLLERKGAENKTRPAGPTAIVPERNPLAAWKTVKPLLKSFEHDDRIFMPTSVEQ